MGLGVEGTSAASSRGCGAAWEVARRSRGVRGRTALPPPHLPPCVSMQTMVLPPPLPLLPPAPLLVGWVASTLTSTSVARRMCGASGWLHHMGSVGQQGQPR